jgi:hypothetical protein
LDSGYAPAGLPCLIAGLIIAQCNNNLAVADMATGKLRMSIKKRSIDPTLPATLLTNRTLAVPKGNMVGG